MGTASEQLGLSIRIPAKPWAPIMLHEEDRDEWSEPPPELEYIGPVRIHLHPPARPKTPPPPLEFIGKTPARAGMPARPDTPAPPLEFVGHHGNRLIKPEQDLKAEDFIATRPAKPLLAEKLKPRLLLAGKKLAGLMEHQIRLLFGKRLTQYQSAGYSWIEAKRLDTLHVPAEVAETLLERGYKAEDVVTLLTRHAARNNGQATDEAIRLVQSRTTPGPMHHAENLARCV